MDSKKYSVAQKDYKKTMNSSIGFFKITLITNGNLKLGMRVCHVGFTIQQVVGVLHGLCVCLVGSRNKRDSSHPIPS